MFKHRREIMLFILRIKRWNSRNRRTLYVTEQQLKRMKRRIIRHGFSIVSENPCSLSHLYSLHKQNNSIASTFFKEVKMNIMKRNPMFVRRNNIVS